MGSPSEVKCLWAQSASAHLANLARSTCSDEMHARISSLLLTHLARCLDMLVAVLGGSRGVVVCRSGFLDAVENALASARAIIEEVSGHCPLYLLMCGPDLMHALGKLYGDLRSALKEEEEAAAEEKEKDDEEEGEGWGCLSEFLLFLDEGIPPLGPEDQLLHDSLEHGVLDSATSTDPSLALKLAQRIAACLGETLESAGFARHLDAFRAECSAAEIRNGKAHTLYLDQFILVLEKATTTAKLSCQQNSSHHRPDRYSLSGTRDSPIPPLESFVCPILKDVMKDPVQIASGQTYEREAIQRWFSHGHTRCPTGVELKNLKMIPNFALRQSIAEWRERNYAIRLENALILFGCEEKDMQLKAMQELCSLCAEDSINKYKVTSMNFLPLLVPLAMSPDAELRQKAFSTLEFLAQDNKENQDMMAKEGVIEAIVKCLAQGYDEAPQAIHLARLLSEQPEIAEKISHAPCALLFLVTKLNDDDCTENVKATLQNLPPTDENLVIMAEVNIMEPLLSRLNKGGVESKILMAKTLARLHMPDACKISVATEESVSTLMKMVSASDDQSEAGILALENLTSVSHVCEETELCGDKIMPALLEVLRSRKSDKAKIGCAHVIANVCTAVAERQAKENGGGGGFESLVEELFTVFQFYGLTPLPRVQFYILQALKGLLQAYESKEGDGLIERMREARIFEVLLKFLSTVSDRQAKQAAMELLGYLAGRCGVGAAMAFRDQPGSLRGIIDLLKREDLNEHECLAVVTILSHLPSDGDGADDVTTDAIEQPPVVSALVGFLESRNEVLAEASLGALLRFTEPTRPEWQVRLAQSRVILCLVTLLGSPRSTTKALAASALANFSCSTPSKSYPPPTTCLCVPWFSRHQSACKLHIGRCSVEGTYCLLEAGAVGPLITVIKEKDQQPACVKAALDALKTLVDFSVGRGCEVIEDAKGITAIVSLLSNQSPEVQDLAATLCEKIFSIAGYRVKYAAAAQIHVVTLAQKGTPFARNIAGQILRQFDMLSSQSTYFGISTT